MGNLHWAYLHNMLRDWGGPDARVVRLACQFRSPNTKGMTVTATGVVTAVRTEGDERLVDVEVWTHDDDGNKLGPGHGTVAVPAGAGAAGLATRGPATSATPCGARSGAR